MLKYLLAIVLLLQFVALSADDTNALSTTASGTDDVDTNTFDDNDTNANDTDIDTNTDDGEDSLVLILCSCKHCANQTNIHSQR